VVGGAHDDLALGHLPHQACSGGGGGGGRGGGMLGGVAAAGKVPPALAAASRQIVPAPALSPGPPCPLSTPTNLAA
jgi:hypothetical protein